MSNYTKTLRNRKTGEEVVVTFLDDYYGKHEYGYMVEGKVYRKEEFEELLDNK